MGAIFFFWTGFSGVANPITAPAFYTPFSTETLDLLPSATEDTDVLPMVTETADSFSTVIDDQVQ